MTRLLRRIAAWLNTRLHIMATDEESARYAAIDRELEELGL